MTISRANCLSAASFRPAGIHLSGAGNPSSLERWRAESFGVEDRGRSALIAAVLGSWLVAVALLPALGGAHPAMPEAQAASDFLARSPPPPAQLAGKGFTSRYRLAYEYFLNPFMGVCVEGQFGYHYLVGASGTVNNSADHSSGYHIMALGSFIFHLGR